MSPIHTDPNGAGLPRMEQLLVASHAAPLDPVDSEKFSTYLALLQKWNARTNLTAIRDEEGILKRHFLESILCARSLPQDIVSLLDFGSGAGFPGIPIAIIRKDLSVTLAESQNKKAAFLREAVRTLELQVEVYAGRAEGIKAKFDCVTLRAVDQMDQAVQSATSLLAKFGWLAILTTLSEAGRIEDVINNRNRPPNHDYNFSWSPQIPLPRDTDRILLLAQKQPA